MNIARGTSAGHARRRARGEVSGHGETLEIARQNSLATRRARAGEIVDLVVAVLEKNPAYQTRSKTAADVAGLLNSLGILSGWRRPFTPDSVRSVLRAAKKEIENRRLDREEDVLVAPSPVSVPAMFGAPHGLDDDLAGLDLTLERPESIGPDAIPARSGGLDDLDDELADLDLTLERDDVAVPAAGVVGKNYPIQDPDDDLADLDRALELEEAHAAGRAAQSPARAGQQPKTSKPARGRSSPVPAASSRSRPAVDENPAGQSPPRREEPATVDAAPTSPAAESDMAESYKDHPGYGIF